MIEFLAILILCYGVGSFFMLVGGIVDGDYNTHPRKITIGQIIFPTYFLAFYMIRLFKTPIKEVKLPKIKNPFKRGQKNV